MKRLSACAVLACVFVSPLVSAHEFVCDKTVNQSSTIALTSFPATLSYQIVITNTHPTSASVLLTAEDALLASEGYVFSQTLPYSVPVGGTVTENFSIEVRTREECLALAAQDGKEDSLIDNIFRITWDVGETQCAARVTCGEVPGGGGATRTMGYFKTHISATEQCLASGPVDLGFVTITTIEDALGLLWGSPNKFDDNSSRNTLDKFRFLLGRQTFVGLCNQRLFGTDPVPADLLTDAVAAMDGTNCADISALIGPVDAFNNSGDSEPFPAGFVGGPAAPSAAMALADDPTTASGQVCSP